MKQIILKGRENASLYLNVYEITNPVAIVQVMHGMEEHQGRYKELAEKLNLAGMSVVTSDMRGHGENCPKEDLGFFGYKNGAQNLIDDQKQITEYIQKTYPGIPVYIFAHSMGTITCRNVLQTNDDKYQKVILSGLPFHQKAAYFGVPLANLICLIKGAKTHGHFLKKMTTGGFNKKVTSPKTKLDWLSYNPSNVQTYLLDPLCGFSFTNAGYRDLIKLTANMDKKRKYQVKNKNLKIAAFVGEDDPCTGFKKGTDKSVDFLRKLGYDVEIHRFAHMRHEILNEDNKEDVFSDIIDFYLK